MLSVLRAELLAIAEWSRLTVLLRTQTEIDAVAIREMRRRELVRRLREIAATN
jgi:hypothetical protein